MKYIHALKGEMKQTDRQTDVNRPDPDGQDLERQGPDRRGPEDRTQITR